MKHQEETIVEIDILFLLRRLWRKKFLILITALFTMSLALVYSIFIANQQFDSTTRIYVVNKAPDGSQNLTAQELQAGTYLVKDYKEIILSQDVVLQVAEELNIEPSFVKKVNVEIPIDTRIVSITVRDTDASEAARIANKMRTIAAQKIIDVTKVSDVTTLEEARPAEKPSSPNVKRNLLLGFVAGLTVSIGLVLLLEILDERIKRPEDIEEKMNIALLGVVPDIKKLK